jgi:integrase
MKRQVESDELAGLLIDPRAGACQASGAPVGLRLHDLRHHAATLTARMPGVTTKELMARIGHASPRAALRYQHATAERDRAIAAFLDDQIKAEHRDERAPIMPMPNSARPVAAGSEP